LIQRAGGSPRVIILILALALGTLATQSLVAQETAQELVAIANIASDPPRQTWALYQLEDRFPQEPIVVELFLKIAGDTNATFPDRKVSIEGLTRSGNREARVVAAMQAIVRRAASQIDGVSDKELLACEAIETIAAIGPPAYPASSTLVAVMTNKTRWLPLRLAAAKALAAIGSAAQNTALNLEAIFLNTREDKQLRLAAIEALASIGSFSIPAFETLGRLIVSQPQAPPEDLKALANAFATIGAAITSNTLSTLKPWHVRSLDEKAAETARFIRAHAQALQGAPLKAVDEVVAQLEAESKRRPCSYPVFLASKVWFEHPKALLGIAASTPFALLFFSVFIFRRQYKNAWEKGLAWFFKPPLHLPSDVNHTLRAWAGGGNLANLVIVTTDVVDHSKLERELGEAKWGQVRELHFGRARDLIARQHGFFVKTIGDAVLAVFRNSVEALEFALAFEADTGDPRVRIRVGINAGQVNFGESDVHGLDVNSAFRVTNKATDGGIWLNNPVKEDVEKYDPRRPIQWTEHPNQELRGIPGRFTLWSIPPASHPPPQEKVRSGDASSSSSPPPSSVQVVPSQPQERSAPREGGAIPGSVITPSPPTAQPLALDAGQERRRRMDAAAPARAALGETIDLLVQVRPLNSPVLGKDDWPLPNKPDLVSSDSREAAVVFPVDAQTRQSRPAKLLVRIVAPDFIVQGRSEVTLQVPSEGNSDLLTFLLKTKKLGHCRVNVEILTDEGEYVGTIPVSTLVNGGASRPERNAVSLVLVVVVSSDACRVVPADRSALPKETAGKTPSTPEIDYHDAHKEVLAKALVRLGLLEQNQELPDPYRTATGVQGKSRVHFLFLPRGGSGISLVAKFDEPERSEKEWLAIEQLRRLNTPPEAMLPVGKNERTDGVIIYRDAASVTLSGNVIDLKDLLLRQLMTNPRNCVTALKKTFDGLALFYRSEPGAARLDQEGHVLHWHDVFPNIAPKLDDIEKTVHNQWRKVNWFVDRWILRSANATSGKSLPNPFYRDPGSSETVIERRLAQLTGPVMLSRVHGDLNLTNILVNLDSQHCPNRIFIIDLSHCEDNKVTAADFARMESEFWHEPIIGLVNDDSEDRTTDLVLQAFVAVRDCLDGRRERLPDSASTLERHCLQFVCQLRQRGITALRGNQDNYCLNDYFVCLFFRHIAALTFPSVTGDKRKVRMAVLGAALTLQLIEDLEAGRYSEGAVNRLHSPIRRCEDILPPEPNPHSQNAD
jgi:class 3 adenylate cyclase